MEHLLERRRAVRDAVLRELRDYARPGAHPLLPDSRPPRVLTRAPPPAREISRRARANTASNIGTVSLPVKVFCWLGWYEPSITSPPGSGLSTRWPNAGRGRRPTCDATACQANCPSATTTAASRSSDSSRARNGAQADRSAGCGLFPGGAQCTAAVMYAPLSVRPSSRRGAGGLGCEPSPVQRGEEPVAGPVPGEHPAGAVGAVRRRRQADDDQGGARVAEARDATAPVDLTGVRSPAGPRHLLPPADQAGTAAARRHLPLHRGQ